ncbi:MAG: sulfotransferase family protein [Bacteroidia bacterium]
MKSPDFYIVGAPKCGTTAFDEYLNQHPKISMTVKELHYWGSDIVFREGKISEETYFKHLQKSFKQGKFLGEGAVWYLVSKTAAQELKQFSPNAKILIFLRNPVEACYSLYYNTHFNGDDVSLTFEEALANQELRKTQFPEFYNCPTIAFQYQSMYLYYEQVKRYIDVFGTDNVKVVVFEEFLKNKQAVYNEVLAFLGVEPHDLDFKPINQNKEIRFVGLRQFITQPKPFVKGIFKTVIPHKPWREKIKRLLWDVNAKEVQRPPMLTETKLQLQQFFAQDIQRLEQLVDKDLGCWR